MNDLLQNNQNINNINNITNTQSEIYDAVVIGSGPSGMTAAIYASRALLKTLVIAGSPSGGQLITTNDVENFPGFPQGITGPELMINLRRQSERFGSVIKEENVKEISGSVDEGFNIQTESGNIYKSKTVIISTGATAKWLGIESETRLRGKGVSACATCDGFFFKDKVVAIVGGGDVAMEEATFLTNFATKVYVLVRKSQEELRASKIMQQRAMSHPKIEFMFNTEVKEVLGESKVEGLKLTNNVTHDEKTLELQGLFIAIGHEPNTKFLQGFIDIDQKGYVVVSDFTKTSKEGVFVSGDVADHKYRQAITAAGFGCMAAMDAIKFINEKNL